MSFAKFMSSGLGRGLRIVAGIALIAIGLVNNAGILAVIGLVPLLAGLLDVCLIGALLFGAPLKGADVRARLNS
ncbi:MAG TPA: YgaP-like transmembrane domain [Anaerolineae bacterium]|nr:YgaP-like transmembrane domain [Anaerolineae bacterium]